MITVEIRNLHYHADHWFVRGLEARLRGARLVQHDGDAVVFPWPGENLDPVVAALREGRHVLVSANAIGTLEAFDRLDSAGRNDRVIAFLNPDRYLPSRQLIRQQIDDGKLGEPGLIRVHQWVTEGTKLGLSALDQISWYFGMLPTFAYAHRIPGLHDQIHLGFEGGGMALATFARLAGSAPYSSLSVIGSRGAAYADERINMQVLHQQGSQQTLQMTESETHWAAVIHTFAKEISLRQNLQSKGGFALGREVGGQFKYWPKVLAIHDAVEQSIATGDAVTLTGGPFHG